MCVRDKRILCTWDSGVVPCHVCVTPCQCLRCFRVSDKCLVLSVMSSYVATQARTEYFPRCVKSGNYSSKTVRHRQLSELSQRWGQLSVLMLTWSWILAVVSPLTILAHLVPRRRDKKVSPSRKIAFTFLLMFLRLWSILKRFWSSNI